MHGLVVSLPYTRCRGAGRLAQAPATPFGQEGGEGRSSSGARTHPPRAPRTRLTTLLNAANRCFEHPLRETRFAAVNKGSAQWSARKTLSSHPPRRSPTWRCSVGSLIRAITDGWVFLLCHIMDRGCCDGASAVGGAHSDMLTMGFRSGPNHPDLSGTELFRQATSWTKDAMTGHSRSVALTLTC